MNFTETPFLYLFFSVYALWLVLRRRYAVRILVLLAGSLLFYGYHRRELLFLIAAYCFVDWTAARWISRSRRPRIPLLAGVTFNLAVLAFWKYTPLVLQSAGSLARFMNLPEPMAAPSSWVIPYGISFYAFTGIAYLVDVYRQSCRAESSFWRYSLYITFFPHLVAGPILRPREFLADLQPGCMPVRPHRPLEAVLLLGRGFFKKMVLADRIALAVDPFFAHSADPSTAGVWGLPYVYLYAFQIYFDFSGYTDIARGLAMLFGFRWPDNFRLPYLAGSVRDFWRRWHMTLSRFLKDYLYIPLGGNRGGRLRAAANIMLTMLLGGIWHGASWNFMLWGGFHGVLLLLHRGWEACAWRFRLQGLAGIPARLWHGLCVAFTFHLVCLGWCFFRLSNPAQSLSCIRSWFVFDRDKAWVGGAADASLWLLLLSYGLLTALLHYSGRIFGWQREEHSREPWVQGFAWGLASAMLLLAVLLSPPGNAPPFLYFQF